MSWCEKMRVKVTEQKGIRGTKVSAKVVIGNVKETKVSEGKDD